MKHDMKVESELLECGDQFFRKFWRYSCTCGLKGTFRSWMSEATDDLLRHEEEVDSGGKLWYEERTEALPTLMRLIVEAIAPAWVATQQELEDEAKTVMGAVADWLDVTAEGMRPSDLAAEVRRQMEVDRARRPSTTDA